MILFTGPISLPKSCLYFHCNRKTAQRHKFMCQGLKGWGRGWRVEGGNGGWREGMEGGGDGGGGRGWLG